MKKNQYQKTLNEIEQLEKKLEDNALRDREARDRIAAAERSLEKYDAALKKALLDGDEKTTTQIEKDTQQLKNDVLSRDNVLLEALAAEREELQAQLQDARDRERKIFAGNAEPVIRDLAGNFDSQARALIETTKKLLAVHRHLRDRNMGTTFAQTIGPATDVLGIMRIPILEGFNLTEYNRGGRFSYNQELVDTMLRRIEEGK